MKDFIEDKEFKNEVANLSILDIIKNIKDLSGEVKGGQNCPFRKLEESASRAIRALEQLKKETELK